MKPLFGLVDIGLLTENEIGDYIKNAFLIIYVLTIFSPLYLTAYGFVFIWGRIAEMFDEQSVKVILKDDKTESKEYKRIIAESSDFIYFETLNDIRKWEGIRKNDISSLERAVTKSKFSNRVFNLLKDKTYWKNREKRKKVAMVLIASFIILIGVSIFFSTPILSYAITTNATLLALILLIENSFLNLKSKD